MSTTSVLSEQIVARLGNLWHLHKTEGFSVYLRSTFGYYASILPKFDCLYVAQIENGDFDKGTIGGILMQWWVVDDDGIRKIANPKLPTLLNDSENLRTGFYPKPVLKFFLDSERIVIGESFGPSCVCRKIAHLKLLSDGKVQIVDEQIVWNTHSLSQQQ